MKRPFFWLLIPLATVALLSVLYVLMWSGDEAPTAEVEDAVQHVASPEPPPPLANEVKPAPEAPAQPDQPVGARPRKPLASTTGQVTAQAPAPAPAAPTAEPVAVPPRQPAAQKPVGREPAPTPPPPSAPDRTSTGSPSDPSTTIKPDDRPLPDEYEVSIEGPKVMMISSERNVRVKVSIEGNGYIAGDETQVVDATIDAHSRELQASVHGGSAFTVVPEQGKRQVMVGDAVAWIFAVTANEHGNHKLYVQITQFIGKSESNEIVRDEIPIRVSVNTLSYVWDYLATHLPETIGSGIVLIVGTVFVVVVARMRKKAGLPPDPGANKSGNR